MFRPRVLGQRSAATNDGVTECDGSSLLNRGNQRGEALSKNATLQTGSFAGSTDAGATRMTAAQPQWHVLWTRSNCEQLVHDQLTAKGYEMFLPRVGRWSRRGGLRYLAHIPMFSGYLFIRQAMDKGNYIEVCKARGLARILGDRWDRLGTVPDREIEAIQKVVGADMPTVTHPYLREGQRVRVIRGPLANAEGILLKTEPKEGLLVLSVDLLRRSIAVRIDCTLVAAA